ncbi:GL19841 [Drosophila persimilis]|uniref:GL19841 n=1 Tax=Drosophila persimilis TaxID=7234 RepID=B4GYA1_DROPE|nr:GL19841 [Drosophila persimilis]
MRPKPRHSQAETQPTDGRPPVQAALALAVLAITSDYTTQPTTTKLRLKLKLNLKPMLEAGVGAEAEAEADEAG